MSTYRFRPVLWLLSAFALCFSAYGQFDTATVLGTVRDSTGAVIQGARVTLENKQTNVPVIKSTDDNGNFEFPNVRIGQYQVRAENTGFQTAIAETFTVQVNARQRVDLTMNVGNAAESVVVSGAAQLLETESSDRGQVINQAAIVNLPLNGRAYADLALLSPGVRRSVLNNNQSVTSRDASFNVNGLRSSLNNFELDGVDNNAYGTSNQGFSNQIVQVTPDAVQEFRVQTNNYSAEYGRAGGAIINASLRSGTNQLHGAAWEFLRNTELNAVGFFQPLGGVKPTFIQNQFGGALGGAILKNKIFVFGDYEGLRRVTRSLQYSTIPSLDQRNGILGTSITNPATGEVYANGVVPQAAISPFARAVLADLPAPNRPSQSATGLSNNFESLPRGALNDDKGDIRYDQYFGQKATAFVRYSHRLANIFDPPGIPGASGGNSNGYIRMLNQQIAPGVTYTINSSSVLEVRVGISLVEGGKTPIGVGLPTDKYGITGLPTDPSIAGGVTAQILGGGFTQLGRQTSNPQFQNPFEVNPKVNYSKILGRHSLKIGYEFQSIHTAIDDFNPKYGQDTYSGQFSRPAGTSASSNAALTQTYNFADFLFGARNNYQINNAAVINYRQRMNFAYVQDDFKLNSKLTLNLGVRYEYGTPQWEANNLLANYDPSTNTLVQAKDGSIADRALVNPDRNNFAPRIGFAYQVHHRTAIRSGYGISYIHFNRMGGENLLGYNGPNIVNVSIDQTPGQGLCSATAAPTTCFRPTQQGYPANLAVPANFNPLVARVNYIPRDNPTGYVQTWHFTVQHELAKDLILDVAYVGNRGVNLMILGDYNQSRAQNQGENLSIQARRPIPNFSWIQIAFGGGFSDYHALQAKIEKRYSAGLYLLNSFTWSKAIDNAAGHLEATSGDNSRINFRDLRNEKGLSNYDQPFNNTTSLIYELPLGRGRHFGGTMNRLADGAVGGWRLSVINTATSGIPINITYAPSSQFQVSNNGVSYRPNYAGGSLVTPEGQRTVNNYLNPAAVVSPYAAGQVYPSTPFGSLGRNTARSHSFEQVDLGLHKDFPLWSEASKLQFRAEAFNLLNTTNFQPANSNQSSSAYGQITSTLPARQIQFSLKLLF